MADARTGTDTNDNLLMSLFSRKAIKVQHEKYPLYDLCEKHPLPEGSGVTMTFNGFRRLAAASVVLGEGSANAAVSLSSRKVVATIISTGRHVKITDLLELTSILPVIDGAVTELADVGASTMDDIIQLAIFGKGTAALGKVGKFAAAKTYLLSCLKSSVASAFHAGTGTNNSCNLQYGLPVVFGFTAGRISAVNGTAPSVSGRMGPILIRKAVSRLNRLSIDRFSDGKYVCVAHPGSLESMYGNAEYKSWLQGWSGGPQSSMYMAEASHPVHGCRILMAPNLPQSREGTGASAITANFNIVLGQGCLAVTELEGGVRLILKRSGPDSVSDPYDQVRTVAMKLRAAACVLNPSAGVIAISTDLS